MSDTALSVRALLARYASPVRADAEVLLCAALNCERAFLIAHGEHVPSDEQRARFEQWMARRVEGWPVAYLTGRRAFWTLDLQVTPDVLIPRPETEWVVEYALQKLDAGVRRVLDLGTGSGAIALAIAKERPRAHVVAIDSSAAALALAQQNAKANDIANVAFRAGEWYAPVLGERFDVIASNPPYVRNDDPHLLEGDVRFEPRAALTSGADGLDALRAIIAAAPAHLVPGGWLVLEHGYDQGAAVRELLQGAQLIDVATVRDLAGHERVSMAMRPAASAPRVS
jgi:release factor glutamine methyltransferase